MKPVTSRTLRQGFPLAVFIAILAFVILISVILMSLRSLLEKNEWEDIYRAGYEPVMLPKLSETDLISGDEIPRIFQPDFGQAVLMAEQALKKGDYTRSEDIIRSTLLFFPGSPTLEKILGNVFYLSGRYADAERVYRLILKRDPADFVVLNNFALAQGMQGKFADAIENMKAVLDMDPESAMTDLNLALLYARSGNRPLARRHLEAARNRLGDDFHAVTLEPSLRELLPDPGTQGGSAPLPDPAEKEMDEP